MLPDPNIRRRRVFQSGSRRGCPRKTGFSGLPLAPLNCFKVFCQKVCTKIVFHSFHPVLQPTLFGTKTFPQLANFFPIDYPICSDCSFNFFGEWFFPLQCDEPLASIQWKPSHSKASYLLTHESLADQHVEVPSLIQRIHETSKALLDTYTHFTTRIFFAAKSIRPIFCGGILGCTSEMLRSTKPSFWRQPARQTNSSEQVA